MQKILLGLKQLDKDTYKIIKYGLFFSVSVCLISTVILSCYIFLGYSILYHLGFSLIKSSFFFAVECIICGIVVDFLRKQII